MLNQTSLRWRKLIILTTVFFILSTSPAFSLESASSELRLKPDKRIAEIATMDEPLSVAVIIEAALIASGTPESRLVERTNQIKTLIDAAPQATGDVRHDAEELLQWMHDTALRRYFVSQTRLDLLLDNGTYNCVSSAVLYLILARSRGIPASGVLTSDHAFCMIQDEEGFVDVETTTAYGFDPGSRHEAVNAFTGRTGFTYVAPGNYRQRTTIAAKELVSLIYQNRISLLQRGRHWGDTVGLALDRWVLAGTETAYDDFKVSITNYAADRDRAGKAEEGLLFLNQAASIIGDNHGLEDSAIALLGNAVVRYLRSGNLQSARLLLESPQLSELVPQSFIDARQRDISVRELENNLKTADFDAALIAIDDALEGGLIDESRWAEFSMFLWSGEARRLSKSGNWEAGLDFLENAPKKTQSLSRWPDLLESYRYNTVVTYHNRFGTAFRGGRLGEAEAILDNALARFPDNRMLIQDRQLLQRRQ